MSRLITIGFLSTVLALGCSGPEFLHDGIVQEESERFGLVAVSYEHDWTDSDSESDVLLTATAQFVSYAALDRDQVASLLALPLDPQRDLPSAENCKLYDLGLESAGNDMAEGEVSGNVELLEAGDLSIQTDTRTVTLSPRHFPWLLPFISGVIYGESQTTLTEEESRVRVTCEGGGSVGPFTAHTDSPAVPRLSRLSDLAPSPLILADNDLDLEVRWETGEQRPEEMIYLALRYSKDKQELALRCRPRDDGVFAIPADLLGELANSRVTLELTRLTRTPFVAAGLQQGELQVAARDTATVQFR